MRQFITSKFFVAVIAFLAVSVSIGALHSRMSQPERFPYFSWTAWTIDDFLKQQRTPQVVFMGSSLVLVPVAGVDADYLGHRVDGAAHHRSLYFENKFKEKTGLTTSTFNFALPGEMPSDGFLITKFLLKEKKAPSVLVYGVGPRDFIDNLLPSPASTDPYRFLSRFGDVSTWSSMLMPEFVERFGYELGRFIYPYGHRGDIANDVLNATGLEVAKLIPLPPNTKPLNNYEVRALMPDYRPYEMHKNEAFFRPSSKEELAKFVDNLPEYRKRYKKMKWDTYRTQLHFFTQTLATARQQGTHVVVVAMPLTDLNRSLLTEESWKAYHNSVTAVAQKEGATFIDFSDNPTFTRSDFGDTVHLHAGGGKHWLDQLIDRVAADRKTVAALSNKPATGVAGVAGGGL